MEEPRLGPTSTGLFQTRYREVTLSAVIFAIITGVVMNASITYAGLKIGFTISGSAIAAVLGFGVLRGILRKGSILEVNIAQTIASSVNIPNSGIIFTVPVLFLIGEELSAGDVDFWLITLACMAGVTLGCSFIIPLRKQMIDIERLRFPSAVGVAAILKSPGAGAAKAVVLVVGIVLGALIYVPAGLPSIKTAARLDELDGLFKAGVISHADRVRTRRVAEWIQQQSAPPEIVERGTVLRDVRDARDKLAESPDDPSLKARVKELDGKAKALADVGGVPDPTALAVADAVAGDLRWDDLRSGAFGWAERPLFGYRDLGLRMKAEVDTDEQPKDRDGDGAPDTPLTVRVDRDQDGRPDLIVENDRIHVGRIIGLPDQIELMFAIAPFALGAGYITGRAGLFVLAGGILAYFVINPIAFALGWMPQIVTAQQAPGYAFQAFNRPLGIGLLLGGAMMGVLFALPAIKEALKSIAGAGRGGKAASDEMGLTPLVITVLVALVLLFVAADYEGNRPINRVCPVTAEPVTRTDATDSLDGYTIAFLDESARQVWSQEWTAEKRAAYMQSQSARPGLLANLSPHVRAAIIALVGAAWIWFAGIIIAQCSGMTDWSPISGMALLTVVLILLLAGAGSVIGAVLIGAALCAAVTIAADMMGDLKTGYLVGGSPRRQQILELSTAWIGPVAAMLTLLLIVQFNLRTVGIPIGPGTPTVAPQAQALQSVITGVQGGELPYALYGFGALLGALLGLGAFPGLGVLVGLSMYLPFFYIATYGIGCVINILLGKIKGRTWAEEWGVPLAAGLIVGESMLQLLINLYVVLLG